VIRFLSFGFAVVIFCLYAAQAVTGVWPLGAGLAAVALGLWLESGHRDIKLFF
jgi:hypothetical protein